MPSEIIKSTSAIAIQITGQNNGPSAIVCVRVYATAKPFALLETTVGALGPLLEIVRKYGIEIVCGFSNGNGGALFVARSAMFDAALPLRVTGPFDMSKEEAKSFSCFRSSSGLWYVYQIERLWQSTLIAIDASRHSRRQNPSTA